MSMKEPVPQQFVYLVIGNNRDDNYQTIEKECGVKITWPKITETENHVIFNIKGPIFNCERAREMLRANLVSIQNFLLYIDSIITFTTRGRGRSIIGGGGAHFHIFVFTDTFPLIDLPRPLFTTYLYLYQSNNKMT